VPCDLTEFNVEVTIRNAIYVGNCEIRNLLQSTSVIYYLYDLIPTYLLDNAV